MQNYVSISVQALKVTLFYFRDSDNAFMQFLVQMGGKKKFFVAA